MKKYTIIGDPHVKLVNLDKINDLFQEVEAYGDTCIWLGDMLDTKDIIQGQCLNALIDNYKASSLKHYILVGNHDLFSLTGTRHSLEALKLLDNVQVVEEPTELHNMLLIPYNYYGNQICKWIEETDKEILIGHLDIKGFDWGNGHHSTDGLDENDFKKFTMVISGHYHVRSQRSNINYIGTPFSHDFGTSNKQHYIAKLDSDAIQLEWIPTDFAKHLTYEINVDGDYSIELSPTNHNRVILEGTIEKVKLAAEAIKDKYPKTKVIQRITFEDEQYSILDKHDNIAAFKIWATTIRKLDPTVVDLGLKILKDKN